MAPAPRRTPRSPATQPGFNRGREPKNKGEQLPPNYLEEADVVALMNACTRGAADIRLRALIAVLYRTGMGISEVLTLTLDDLDEERGTIRIEGSNEHRRRTIGMDRGGWKELGHWLKERERRQLPPGPVFCTHSREEGRPPGNAIGSPQVRTALKHVAARAGLSGRFNPDSFRHTFAADVILDGWPLPHLQTQLGVTTLTGVQELLNHLNIKGPDDEDVAAIVRTRRWSSQLEPIEPPKIRPPKSRGASSRSQVA